MNVINLSENTKVKKHNLISIQMLFLIEIRITYEFYNFREKISLFLAMHVKT